MTVSELFAVACGLSLLFLFASFWQGDGSNQLSLLPSPILAQTVGRGWEQPRGPQLEAEE